MQLDPDCASLVGQLHLQHARHAERLQAVVRPLPGRPGGNTYTDVARVARTVTSISKGVCAYSEATHTFRLPAWLRANLELCDAPATTASAPSRHRRPRPSRRRHPRRRVVCTRSTTSRSPRTTPTIATTFDAEAVGRPLQPVPRHPRAGDRQADDHHGIHRGGHVDASPCSRSRHRRARGRRALRTGQRADVLQADEAFAPRHHGHLHVRGAVHAREGAGRLTVPQTTEWVENVVDQAGMAALNALGTPVYQCNDIESTLEAPLALRGRKPAAAAGLAQPATAALRPPPPDSLPTGAG